LNLGFHKPANLVCLNATPAVIRVQLHAKKTGVHVDWRPLPAGPNRGEPKQADIRKKTVLFDQN
jgi:hypothetical protein